MTGLRMICQSIPSRLFLIIVLAFMIAACSGGSNSSSGSTGSGSDQSSGGDGSGGSGGGDTSSGWDSLTRIADSLDFYYYDLYQPDVAIDSAGNVLAVWVREFNSDSDELPTVWTNVYRAGAWGTAFQLSTDLAIEPAVALNANGQGLAAYCERTYDSSGLVWNDTIWARRYANGVWQSAERVSHAPSATSGTYAYQPQVGVDADGNAIVVWRQDDTTTGTYDGVWASHHNGTSWSTPERLDTLHKSYCDSLTLAVNANGTAAVVWIEDTYTYDMAQSISGCGNCTLPNTWARIYSGGVWQSSVKIGNPDIDGYDSASRPHVSINASADAVAVWEEHTSAHGYRVMTSSYSASGDTWTPATPLATSADYLSWPSVDIDATGNIAAVWSAHDAVADEDQGVLRYYDGFTGNWTDELAFEDGVDDLFGGPQLGFDANGNLWIAWLQYLEMQGVQMHARRYIPGTGFEAQMTPGDSNAIALDVSGPGYVALLGLREEYSTNPFGIFNAPWAILYSP